jgi:hypothetical protein
LGKVKRMEIVLIVAEKEYKRLETTHQVRKDLTRDHWQQAAAPCCTRPGEGSQATGSSTLLHSPWRGLARCSEYYRAEEHDSAIWLEIPLSKAPMTYPMPHESYF